MAFAFHQSFTLSLRLASIGLIVLLSGCTDSEDDLAGYIDSQPTRISSQGYGQIEEMFVTRGSLVRNGQLLFRLESQTQRDALVLQQALLQSAQADLDNLVRGASKERIDALDAVVKQAQYTFDLSKRQFVRLSKLKKDQFVSPNDLDMAETAMQVNEQALVQAKQDYADLTKPPREEVLRQKQAQVDARQAELSHAEWSLAQQTVYAQQDAFVTDIYLKQYEDAKPNQPVLALHSHKKDVIFYLPMRLLPDVNIGSAVYLRCTRCNNGFAKATVNYISDQAEFTPPIVYSAAVNEKYVFYTKATIVDPKQRAFFKLGQPVDIILYEPNSTDRMVG